MSVPHQYPVKLNAALDEDDAAGGSGGSGGDEPSVPSYVVISCALRGNKTKIDKSGTIQSKRKEESRKKRQSESKSESASAMQARRRFWKRVSPPAYQVVLRINDPTITERLTELQGRLKVRNGFLLCRGCLSSLPASSNNHTTTLTCSFLTHHHQRNAPRQSPRILLTRRAHKLR